MRNSKLTTITDALLLFLAFIIFIDSVLDMKDTVLLKQKLMVDPCAKICQTCFTSSHPFFYFVSIKLKWI